MPCTDKLYGSIWYCAVVWRRGTWEMEMEAGMSLVTYVCVLLCFFLFFFLPPPPHCSVWRDVQAQARTIHGRLAS